MVSLRPLAALPVVGVVADGRTYRHLLYLLIALPLAFIYSGFVTFALVFGLVFSVVLVGIGVLIVAVIGSRLVAGLERWLSNRLLGTDLVAPDDLPAAADDSSADATASVRAYLAAPSTWRGLGYLSLKFWVALLAFAPLFVLSNALTLVAAPVRYPYTTQFGEVDGEPVLWTVDAAPEAALATAIGVVGVFVGLHLTNLIAGGARLMAVGLLDGDAGAGANGSTDSDAVDGGVTVDRDTPDGGTADREPGAEERAEADESPGVDKSPEADENADRDGSAADGFEFDGDPTPADSDERLGDADADDARRGDRD
ncbi:two-component system sensor kinase [Halorubrum californiense DSM 19288]|uniref:Two-component system sensor kinase n=1 Tax=Halorubrum californiense DSM 19288 TaxID=1227465 RepID=M0ELA6_9EURY|nr:MULTISPECIES: sensor domain-containing protein [Halorubrum]ELZ48536.1 two-component system sensor kinase [Halorubrum californiense DSM 19288]TKX65635.1 histidine kinase [Halorubrum sp. GN11GM_10-3_MGM]